MSTTRRQKSWDRACRKHQLSTNELHELRLSVENKERNETYMIVQQIWITLLHRLGQTGIDDPYVFVKAYLMSDVAVQMLMAKGCRVTYCEKHADVEAEFLFRLGEETIKEAKKK